MGLYALLVPNFGAFDYYFMLDVVGITQFQYSMISEPRNLGWRGPPAEDNKYYKIKARPNPESFVGH